MDPAESRCHGLWCNCPETPYCLIQGVSRYIALNVLVLRASKTRIPSISAQLSTQASVAVVAGRFMHIDGDRRRYIVSWGHAGDDSTFCAQLLNVHGSQRHFSILCPRVPAGAVRERPRHVCRRRMRSGERMRYSPTHGFLRGPFPI
jgi:hypothetical protein